MALNEHDTGGLERDPRLDRLYPQTGLEEPRAELDAAIRAAARREVQARPHALGARLRRWRLPISIAAVVTLSVSVVTLMREEGADRVEGGLPPTMMERTAPAAPAGGDAELKAKESADALPRAPVPAPQALPAPSAEQARRLRRLDAPAAGKVKPAEPSSADIRQRAAGAANEFRSQGPVSAAPAKRPAPSAGRALSAPVPSAKDALVEAEEDSAGARGLKKSERLLTDSQVNVLIGELDGASPDTWLERIERLRQEGRNEEADELVVEFRRRFPGHPVPVREGARGN